MDLSCITGTFSAGQRMLSHRKWSCIKEEEIVCSLFLHAIKFYFPPPQKHHREPPPPGNLDSVRRFSTSHHKLPPNMHHPHVLPNS
jgi:hypothetical protein